MRIKALSGSYSKPEKEKPPEGGLKCVDSRDRRVFPAIRTDMSAQQRQDLLWQLVGLRNHRVASLLQDLGT